MVDYVQKVNNCNHANITVQTGSSSLVCYSMENWNGTICETDLFLRTFTFNIKIRKFNSCKNKDTMGTVPLFALGVVHKYVD
jgi:hypothetical protein